MDGIFVAFILVVLFIVIVAVVYSNNRRREAPPPPPLSGYRSPRQPLLGSCSCAALNCPFGSASGCVRIQYNGQDVSRLANNNTNTSLKLTDCSAWYLQSMSGGYYLAQASYCNKTHTCCVWNYMVADSTGLYTTTEDPNKSSNPSKYLVTLPPSGTGVVSFGPINGFLYNLQWTGTDTQGNGYVTALTSGTTIFNVVSA